MANMVVSGAGTTAVNGTYVESGTYNGKPQYYKVGTGHTLEWDPYNWTEDVWQIYDWEDYYYFGNGDVATPNLATWQTASGASPAPTVTLEQSGTTHEGELTISSLSYLRTKKT